jgi:hypothetical protein
LGWIVLGGLLGYACIFAFCALLALAGECLERGCPSVGEVVERR